MNALSLELKTYTSSCVVNDFVPYVRVGMTDQLGWGASPLDDQEVFARVGLEYGF
ncbi:MAG: hypothetical protein ACI9LG_002505 [Moritella dasanensis]|jgi:hypothetical protein